MQYKWNNKQYFWFGKMLFYSNTKITCPSYRYSRSIGVFLAFLLRARGNQRCLVVNVTLDSSSRTISGCLAFSWLAPARTSSSRTNDGPDRIGALSIGFEHSYGNVGSGCQATKTFPLNAGATRWTKLWGFALATWTFSYCFSVTKWFQRRKTRPHSDMMQELNLTALRRGWQGLSKNHMLHTHSS